MTLHARLVRNVFQPLSLWRAGESRQLRYQAEFERTQYLPADELNALRWRRLRELLQHAFAACPFYRRRFDAAGLHPLDLKGPYDLRALPPLEKADIQRNLTDMIARGWPEADLIRNQTGGSTGTPIAFYLGRDRKCSRAAATVRHNRWAGYDVGDSAAVLWGAPRDRPADGWRSRVRGWALAEPSWLDAGQLDEARLVAFRAELWRRRPRVLQAYARAVVLFARWLEARGLDVPRPRSIITSAEVLEDADRALVERVFGCRVFNRYGCREVSVIASECDAHAGLHVMAEGLFVEVETAAGPARPGEVGSVLITDLLNHAMPLIRYRIGDMAAFAPGDCPCGRRLPRLEKIAGRVTDFLVGAGGGLVSGVFLATYVVAQRPSLGQVQIVQERAGEVTYRVRPGVGYDAAADGLYLERATRDHLGTDARCEVEVVDALPASASGKFLFSRSSVTPAFLQTSRP
ncbi:MAG: phenylacetate--CoA ligase family protein [Gemmataceae bacterium]